METEPPTPDVLALTEALVSRIASDRDLAPHFPADAGGPVADLVRCASGGPCVGGLADASVPWIAGLGHREFSLLASHVADALDDLGVEPDVAADLLAGLARLRAVVVA